MRRTTLHIIICALLVGWASVPAGAGSLSGYMTCYRALSERGASVKRSIASIGQDVVPVPTFKGNRKGFYLFTEDSSYLQLLTGQPSAEDDHYARYFLGIQIPGRRMLYATYIEDKTGVKGPRLELSQAPAQAAQGKYRMIRALETLDDAARAAFSSELQDRVGTVTESFQKGIQDLQEQVRQLTAKSAPDNQIQPLYVKQAKLKADTERALEICKDTSSTDSDDKTLRHAVLDELEKFDRATAAVRMRWHHKQNNSNYNSNYNYNGTDQN